jgi:hypothetical protein
MRNIRHITLTTGHTRDSAPAEVPEHITEAMWPLIEHIANSGANAETLPMADIGAALPGYSVSGRAEGRCLVATVWADGPPSLVVASIGVALHSRCGSALWRGLHQWGTLPVVTDPEHPPAEPWVAAALDMGALQHPDCLGWLGDFERCLAWAWLRAK